MEILTALENELEQLPHALVTEYQLGVLVHRLYQAKVYQGKPLRLRKAMVDNAAYTRIARRLIDAGIVSRAPRYPRHLMLLAGQEKPETAVSACLVDPFCYLSHHTALVQHGLATKKSPQVYVTSPPPSAWRRAAMARMADDLGEDLGKYLDSGLPRLTWHKLDRIGAHRVHRHNIGELGEVVRLGTQALPMSSAGQTILDCLRHPQWAGGMKHVLRVFDAAAGKHREAIIRIVDQRGTAIDKVRVGYLFEERLRIADPAFERWVGCAQRGGSRKLDPEADYAPRWSERWCLSLNISNCLAHAG